MRERVGIVAVLFMGIFLVACGGPTDKEGKSLKIGDQYVMSKNGLERVPFLKDKQGNKVDVGKEYLMTPAGLEPIPYLKDKSGNKVEVGGEYLMAPEGLKLFHRRTIHGTVLDSDGKPVTGIDVALDHTDYKTATDGNGSFALPFVEGYVKLTLSAANIPEWCNLENTESVFLDLEQHPKGWDAGTIKIPCISAGTKPDQSIWTTIDHNFVDNGDGTITDVKNGLMWEAKVKEQDVAWQKAADYAQGLNLAGHSDWRLPTADELATLHEANVACGWHGLSVVGGAITLWGSEQKDPGSALIFNICSGKIRYSQGLDEGQGVNPSALAVRRAGK